MYLLTGKLTHEPISAGLPSNGKLILAWLPVQAQLFKDTYKRHEGRTCREEMQGGHARKICREDMQGRIAEKTCRADMRERHAVKT